VFLLRSSENISYLISRTIRSIYSNSNSNNSNYSNSILIRRSLKKMIAKRLVKNVSSSNKRMIGSYAYNIAKKMMPKISDTERGNATHLITHLIKLLQPLLQLPQ